MTRIIRGFAIVASLSSGVAASGVAACGGAPEAVRPEEARASADVPVAVRDAARGLLGDKARVGVEHEGGVTAYEAETRTELEVVFDAAGNVLEAEVEIPAALVPASVLDAVMAQAPAGARVSEATIVAAGAVLLYEVELRLADGGEVEYRVAQDGTVTQVGQEAADDDDDDAAAAAGSPDRDDDDDDGPDGEDADD